MSNREQASDIVVIGSGPSAAAACVGLVRSGTKITVLESARSVPGGLVLQANGRNLIRLGKKPANQESHVSTEDPRTRWIHDLALGGLSNHWTGAVPRYHSDDFTDGERLHERYRWPTTYDDVAPYYAKVEELLGVTAGSAGTSTVPPSEHATRTSLPGPWQSLARLAATFDRSLIPIPLSTGPRWGIKSGGTPFNAYTDVLKPLEASGRIEIRTGAHVLRLEHGDDGLVSRVIYFDVEQQNEASIGCKAVIIAVGAIGTTKLLLNSDSPQHPGGLGNQNGLLGRFLHDHVHDMCVFDLKRSLPRLGHPAYLPRAPYAKSPPLRGAGCVIGGRVSQLDRLLTLVPSPARRFGVVIFGSMLPEERNQVCLDSAHDRYGMPTVDIRLRYREEDKAATTEARNDLFNLFDLAGYKPKIAWTLGDPVPGSSVHFGGTARMHESPEYGVTDGWGRLHSVRNVAVGDASVFTTCVEKNPTLTAMALSYRAAERLAVDLKAGSLRPAVHA